MEELIKVKVKWLHGKPFFYIDDPAFSDIYQELGGSILKGRKKTPCAIQIIIKPHTNKAILRVMKGFSFSAHNLPGRPRKLSRPRGRTVSTSQGLCD